MLRLFLLVLYLIASPVASPHAKQGNQWNSPRLSRSLHALTADAGAGNDPDGTSSSRPPITPTIDSGAGNDPNG